MNGFCTGVNCFSTVANRGCNGAKGNSNGANRNCTTANCFYTGAKGNCNGVK